MAPHPDVVLATKFAAYPFRGRASVLKALDRSLARLGRKSVDLYQVHWLPRFLSIPTLMRELSIAHRDGRVRAIGVSNVDAAQLRIAHFVLGEAGIPLATNQEEYSLLKRGPEVNGVLDTCRAHRPPARRRARAGALRWLMQQGALPIPGAKNARQARSDAGALQISLDSAEMDSLDQITRPCRV